MTFRDAIQKLATIGIRQQHIYLIDLALLCEMAWADGKIQDGELDILFDYLDHHVDNINRIAGCEVLTLQEAKDFILHFIVDKPQEKFKIIRQVITAIRICDKDPAIVENTRSDILNACLDIAASSVTRYPYGKGERFSDEEKTYYHNIAYILQRAAQ